MVCYEILMLCYEISMLCYAMVYVVKDQHSATVKGVALAFIWTKYNSLHLCAKWFTLALWSWRTRFLNVVSLFSESLFHYYLHLEIGIALHFINQRVPSPKKAMCQVWLKLSHWARQKNLKSLWYNDHRPIPIRIAHKHLAQVSYKKNIIRGHRPHHSPRKQFQ